MPELFVRCPTCKGSRIVPSEKHRGPIDCPTCISEGFVRYGTEPGHEHEWMTTDVQPLQDRRGWWQSNAVMRARHVRCVCGKSAVEVNGGLSV